VSPKSLGRISYMSRNWKKYNRKLVKRRILGVSQKKEKKRGRSYVYPNQLIILLLFLKFALRLPYRKT
jgi:hypothetical protein